MSQASLITTGPTEALWLIYIVKAANVMFLMAQMADTLQALQRRCNTLRCAAM